LIVDKIESRDDAEKPRATIEAVYAQIKSDVGEAMALLPNSYPGGQGMEQGRPTAYTASALRSFVHLELEEWSLASDAANLVIGNGALLDNYVDNFNGSQENSVASLFEVQYGGVTGATTGNQSQSFAPPDFNNGSAFI